MTPAAVDFAFREILAGGQPTFEVHTDGALQGTFTLAKMLEGNDEDLDLCEWLSQAAVTAEYRTGGGAIEITISVPTIMPRRPSAASGSGVCDPEDFMTALKIWVALGVVVFMVSVAPLTAVAIAKILAEPASNEVRK